MKFLTYVDDERNSTFTKNSLAVVHQGRRVNHMDGLVGEQTWFVNNGDHAESIDHTQDKDSKTYKLKLLWNSAAHYAQIERGYIRIE